MNVKITGIRDLLFHVYPVFSHILGHLQVGDLETLYIASSHVLLILIEFNHLI